MKALKIIECVPNFSEGQDEKLIEALSKAIEHTEGVRLLHVDPGKSTNRTVVTFAGNPEAVIEAAFQAIKLASELIDMRFHKGEHPRMGATDVCPLIPISGISMEETVAFSKKLAARVGSELSIPVYLYENSATHPSRKNLADIRSGEYEGLEEKMKNPDWEPDFGPKTFNPKSGATVIGARDFLIAYNVNLNTKSAKLANEIAFDIRENGRPVKDPQTGKLIKNQHGEILRTPGTCKSLKAIGWYIDEYGQAQVSMNLTNMQETPLHKAFEECRKSADRLGLVVTGSELVGLVPKKALLDAGVYFMKKQNRSLGISEEELIDLAIQSLGLNSLALFEPQKRIIEYMLEDKTNKLVDLSLKKFADETASESPAPGGGSVSAYLGALGASLGAMVANLTAHKKGYEDRLEFFSEYGVQAQVKIKELLFLVDEDTKAFNAIMESFRLPKNTAEEKSIRKKAIRKANLYAIEIPLKTMETAASCLPLLRAMIENGNPNSISDAGVGALCIQAAVSGAALNVQINAASLDDEVKKAAYFEKAETIETKTGIEVKELIITIKKKIIS
ncbi:MAG: glutamate formimidoyltransferase [Saprospiraceae bacterium]|jgi:glutamate formiminotransferase/formiminotetrahydrofolate cyclodeaminase